MKTKAIDLMSKTVALIVTFSSVGNQKKVSSSQVEVDADKEWIRVSKTLLECDEYDAIGHLDSEIKSWLDSRALPSLLKRGIYLLPIPMVQEADAKLKDFAEQRRYLVEKFVSVYKVHVKEARARLRELFSESDYRSSMQIRGDFNLSWQFTSFNTPASLQQISKELFEQEKQKAEATWRDAATSIEQMLLSNLSEMVNHLVEKLTPGEDGKKKVFRNSMVSNMQEFLANLNMRNVTDNAQLKALSDQAKKLIVGVEAQQLRDEEGLRDSIRNGFDKIKSKLDDLVEVKPKRAISLEEVA